MIDITRAYGPGAKGLMLSTFYGKHLEKAEYLSWKLNDINYM
jgi:hypothetical protein